MAGHWATTRRRTPSLADRGRASILGGVRLVSLLPSATEIVYALGLGGELVGVTFECDEPPAARAEKTVVVGGLDTHGMTPREIDDYVRGQLASGAELYTLHAQALAALRPDLILTQDLCRVCALPTGQVSDALDYLGCHADVLSLDPHTLDEVIESIVAVGQRTGVPGRAADLAAGLRARLDRVAALVAGRPRPRVAVAEWVDPPFTAGHWVPDLVTAAGGLPVACRPGQPSAETTWAAVADEEPDLVIVAPCGYHLDGAAEQAATAVAALAEAAQAKAAQARAAQARAAQARAAQAETTLPGVPVWAIDADGIVVRPGPRLVTGVEAIASVLHPGAVPPAPPGAGRRGA
jgi:iron complex transport system substrate-binding protein